MTTLHSIIDWAEFWSTGGPGQGSSCAVISATGLDSGKPAMFYRLSSRVYVAAFLAPGHVRADENWIVTEKADEDLGSPGERSFPMTVLWHDGEVVQ